MQNPISNLQRRILSKSKEPNIIDEYHYFMVHYGYIPFDDFKKMDALLKDELIKRINEDNKRNKFTKRKMK